MVRSKMPVVIEPATPIKETTKTTAICLANVTICLSSTATRLPKTSFDTAAAPPSLVGLPRIGKDKKLVGDKARFAALLPTFMVERLVLGVMVMRGRLSLKVLLIIPGTFLLGPSVVVAAAESLAVREAKESALLFLFSEVSPDEPVCRCVCAQEA